LAIEYLLAPLNYLLMALALTSPNARVGRGGNFALGILFFHFYNNMINVGQSWVGEGLIHWLVYLLLLHGIIFISATSFLYIRQR